MLLFAHLCIGAIAGLFFARLTGHRYMVLIGMIGCILPDLVDKPLGLISPGGFPGHEALILHTLPALTILCLAGILAYRFLRPPLPAAMALLVLAVALHQAMDLVWVSPVRWLFPFLGPLHRSSLYLIPSFTGDAGGRVIWIPAGFIGQEVAAELFSQSEWIFAAVLVLILLEPRLGERAIRWGSALLAVLALATLAAFATLAGLPVPVIDNGYRIEELLLAVSAAGAFALWYYGRGGREERKEAGGAPGTPR